MSTPRVGVYARQSVRVDEGVERQVELSTAYAEIQGWTVVKAYVDNDTSATKVRGPESQWAALLVDIDAGRIDTIVVVAIDRLLRRQADIYQLVEPTRKVRTVAIRQGIDTATSAGKMTLRILVAVAEQEIDVKRERALPYRAARRAAGHPGAGRTVYGYHWLHSSARDASGTRYAIDPAEASYVRADLEELLNGGTLASACRLLNDQGVTTRQGTIWRPTTMCRLLTNPFIAGLLPPVQATGHHDDLALDLESCSAGAWEAIVTVDQLTATRALLVDPRRRTQRGTERKWLMSGLAICGVCEGPVRSAKSKEGHHAYRCVTGCFQRRGDILDDYARHVVLQRLQEADAASLMTPRHNADIPELKARQAALEAKGDQLLRYSMDGLITDAQFRQEKQLVDIEHATVSDELTDALRHDPLASVLSADAIAAAFDGLSLARQRAVLGRLFVLSISRVGKGVRVTSLEAAEATTNVVWAVPGRKVMTPVAWGDSLLMTPALSEDAKGVVAAMK